MEEFRQSESMLKEIHELRKNISDLKHKIISLESHIHSRDSQINILKKELELLSGEKNNSDANKTLEIKRLNNKIKMTEIEKNKLDIFREEWKGTSKTKREAMAKSQIENLKNTNNFLFKVIEEICSVQGFDCDIFKNICDLCTDSKDPLIGKLLVCLNLKTPTDLSFKDKGF